jgi:hypothetical protein
LRLHDIEFATRMLTVSRAMVHVLPRFHPEGGRFLVKGYPKDGEYRRLKLSVQITAKLKAYVEERGLGRDDLIFQAPGLEEPRIRKLRLVADPDSLGRTEPNPEGHTYRHGTMTAYTLGRCRCDYCRGAYASYRAMRRAQGKDNPGRPRSLDTDGHVSGQWFRESIWRPAIAAPGVEIKVRLHHLRHAHASWLLRGRCRRNGPRRAGQDQEPRCSGLTAAQRFESARCARPAKLEPDGAAVPPAAVTPTLRDGLHQSQAATGHILWARCTAHRDAAGAAVGHRDHHGTHAAKDGDIETAPESGGRVLQGVGR